MEHDTEVPAESDRRRQASQSYEMIARTAGRMAHDLKNILTAIIVNTEIALEDAELRNEGSREELDEVLRAAQRANGLLDQLLAFGRRQVLRMDIVDLRSALAPPIDMMRDLFGPRFRIRFEEPAGAVIVRADRDRLSQLMANLVANARDATPDGGMVWVRVRSVSLSAERRYGEVVVPAGNWALITVEDEGAGMTPEVLDRAFQPFFTTKGGRVGAGLGLSVAYGIVKQSGGFIFASSREGRGTLFEIFLPEVTQ